MSQRILSQENNTHLGCIKLPSGDYTGSVEESLGYLMDAHFPCSWGPSGGLGRGPMIEGDYKPKEWRLAAKVVFPSGEEWAIKTFEPYKAPGKDGIYPISLQENRIFSRNPSKHL
jgi:hypothetical protein